MLNKWDMFEVLKVTCTLYFAHKECLIKISGYEDFKEILTTKSNTITANKSRDACCSGPLFVSVFVCTVDLKGQVQQRHK